MLEQLPARRPEVRAAPHVRDRRPRVLEQRLRFGIGFDDEHVQQRLNRRLLFHGNLQLNVSVLA
jgi:hypothetical protein